MKTQNYFPFLVILLAYFTSSAQINHLQVIGHQLGGFSDSLVSDAHFGQALAAIGDINLDGVPDLGVGALYQDSVSARQYERLGAFYINLMNSNGTVKRTINLTRALFNTVFSGPEDLGVTGRHGYAMEGIGDINKDGIPDLALGFPDYETNIQLKDAGGVLILLMNEDGSILSHSWLDKSNFSSLQRDDRFGHSISYLGDINLDGYPEIAVSAPRHAVSSQLYGAVWIISLLPDGSPYFYKKIENRYIQTPNQYWAFGWALESVPDLDGDGVPELLVGTPHGTFDLEPVTGNVSVLFLTPTLDVKGFRNINFYDSNLGREKISNDSHFGESIAYLGDLNGDGHPEIAIGASLDEFMSEQQERIWCLSLDQKGEADVFVDLSANALGKWLSLDPFERFGQQLCGAIDLDGDGQSELIASARKPGGRGTVSVLFGLQQQLSSQEESLGKMDFYVYPNPAKEYIFIQGPEEELKRFIIKDANGKTITGNFLIAKAINVSHLKTGTYFLQLETKMGEWKTFPFIKS